MDAAIPGYCHNQKSLLCLIVYGTAIGLLIGAWLTRNEFPISLILGGSGVLTFFLAMAFHRLTVVDQGESLSIRFGPLPVFRRTIRYADIVKAEVGRMRAFQATVLTASSAAATFS